MTASRVLVVAEQLRRNPPGGIGTYIRGLLQGLDALEPGNRPAVELLASRPRGGDSPDLMAGLGYPVHNSMLPGPVLTRAWDRGLVRAPRGFGLIHATSVASLETGSVPLVATVHDLLWRRLPTAYPHRGREWHEAALARLLHRADRFIVPAEEVASDLQNAGAPAEAVTVIPMGSDHLPPPDAAAGAALLERLGVTGPYLLSVGTLEPRKNLVRLIEAYQRIRSELPEPWPLLLVGPSGWGKQVAPAAGVVLTGLISAGELSALYGQARLLAYVPLVEGFGLPPVEAMGFGAPVVASPLPGTGGAAFEVDPHDVESIAAGILRVATDEAERSRLIAAGRAHSRDLAWSSIARRHIAVWNEASDG